MNKIKVGDIYTRKNGNGSCTIKNICLKGRGYEVYYRMHDSHDWLVMSKSKFLKEFKEVEWVEYADL